MVRGTRLRAVRAERFVVRFSYVGKPQKEDNAMKYDAHRILAEARENVSRLRENQFPPERKIERADQFNEPPAARGPSVETRSERFRREIQEQEQQFELERHERKRAERRHKQADWSAWERWADAKIATAIAEERRVVCETMGSEVRSAIETIYSDIGEEVQKLRQEIVCLQATLDASVSELRGLMKADGAKVIDMPKRASN
jgi:hypothetical protein